MFTHDYRHVILTRFNVQVDFAPSGIGLEESWLQSRLQPFLTLTVPSVRAQRQTPDAWLVFFDQGTPDWFRESIKSTLDVLTPVYVAGQLTDQRIAEEVAKAGLTDKGHLITTRLDNDDALSAAYVERVASLFDYQDRLFVEFRRGYQYADGQFYYTSWRSNPFLSLIEETRELNFTTVFCMPHTEVVDSQPVVSITRGRHWLQNVHQASTTSRGVTSPFPRISRSTPTGFVPPGLPATTQFQRAQTMSRGVVSAAYNAASAAARVVRRRTAHGKS